MLAKAAAVFTHSMPHCHCHHHFDRELRPPRHAVLEDVLSDSRNRLVHAYLNLVRFLRPQYILMEQVRLWGAWFRAWFRT